jgi:hypothetical protein
MRGAAAERSPSRSSPARRPTRPPRAACAPEAGPVCPAPGTQHELVGAWRAFLTALAAALSAGAAVKRDPQFRAATAAIAELKTRCC